MNHCFAIGLVGDCWWVGQRWEFNFKVQTEQKIHGTTGNTTGLRCRLKHTVYRIMLRVAFELCIQHIINSKADRRALRKKIVQVLVLGSKRKKNCANTIQGQNFPPRGLDSPPSFVCERDICCFKPGKKEQSTWSS